jgi:hypothetical protein
MLASEINKRHEQAQEIMRKINNEDEIERLNKIMERKTNYEKKLEKLEKHRAKTVQSLVNKNRSKM